MHENAHAQLIVRYLSNEATPQEIEQLLDWVYSNPDHLKIFNDQLRVWNQTIIPEHTYDLSNGLKILNDKVDQLEKDTRVNNRLLTWTNIAATVSILLVAGLIIYLLGTYATSREHQLTYVQRQTSAAHRLIVNLDDGSRVKLNAHSSLKFPEQFAGENRKVQLDGEAFFEVQRDSLRPFIIQTGELVTEVLGTSFNINAQGNEIIVTVATGKVKVSHGNDYKIILPGEQIRYSATDKNLTQSKADLEAELAWKDDILLFDDTPMDAVAKTLEAWYGVNITFENTAIRHCLITGKYANLSLEKVLHAIEFSTGLHATVANKTVTFSGAGCEQSMSR